MTESHFEKKSRLIVPGAKHTMYLLYCTGCNIYKLIMASAPVGPGGTLSCPVCRARNQHGPGIERAYGCVHTKKFQITLPEEVRGDAPYKTFEQKLTALFKESGREVESIKVFNGATRYEIEVRL